MRRRELSADNARGFWLSPVVAGLAAWTALRAEQEALAHDESLPPEKRL